MCTALNVDKAYQEKDNMLWGYFAEPTPSPRPPLMGDTLALLFSLSKLRLRHASLITTSSFWSALISKDSDGDLSDANIDIDGAGGTGIWLGWLLATREWDVDTDADGGVEGLEVM